MNTKITSKPFGTVQNNDVTLYTLTNGETSVDISSLGATLVSIKTPDKDGNVVDVLLGYDTVEEYVANGGYVGAVIGRHGNRLKNAEFTLNREVYKLGANDGTNNLHGGPVGFDKYVWDCEVVTVDGSEVLSCTMTSPDMDQGYPGTMDVCVKYSLTQDNALVLEYFAKSDKDTICNLTNHSYFNLNGHNTGSIEGHTMQINAPFYTPVDEDCTPTGVVASVEGTVFDFTKGRVVGDDINNVPDFAITSGYDHNFVLATKEKQMALAVVTTGNVSGITMETYTNKPAVQFYAGNMLADDLAGKNGAVYQKRSGFCLETQFCPNAMMWQHLGSPILRAGDVYNFTTAYKFSK